MSWNDQNGPWGPKPDKKASKKPDQDENGNPWARKSGGQNPMQPPDLGPFLDDLMDKLRAMKPKGHGQAIGMALAVLVGLWLLSGFYQVAANQVGVVMRFGAYTRTEKPGLRYHLPAPIETVSLPVITDQKEIRVGFQKLGRSSDDTRSIPEESMMLTQDENIINVEFTVFWRVSDVTKYLFEIRDPDITIKMAAESVMREVIGQNKLQFALTDGRSQIAEETRTRLQAMMDEYNAGIVVTQINLQKVSVPDEVKAAFQDVVNARLDQERFQNQALVHINKVIPDAKGQAAQMLQQAMGYRDQKIAVAQGDADRFREVLAAYNASRDVTAKRLYLETMEDILAKAQKIIVDKNSGTIPLAPLQELLRGKNEGGRP